MLKTFITQFKFFIRRCQYTLLFHVSKPQYYKLIWSIKNRGLFDKKPTLALNHQNIQCFQPRLDKDDYDKLLNLLARTHEFMKTSHCFYSLCAGSLIGALLYDDMVPWDDDVDIFCLESQKKQLLSHLTSHGLTYIELATKARLVMSEPCYIGRIYDKQNSHWPYIDIAWLSEVNKTYWLDRSNHLLFQSTAFNHNEMHCFGDLKVQVSPKAVGEHPKSFDYALPPGFNHFNDQTIPTYESFKVRLDELASLYPILNERHQRKARYLDSSP